MLRSGEMIGNRYEILELLGSGGMAYVYKAKCHKLNRYVAMKVLKQEFQNDAVFLQKFQIEAQAAAALSHPNIVNVYDVGEEDGLFYIVMEYVDGVTLKDYILEKGRLMPKEAVDISMQIASGIQAAHGRHTIHRDIKPQNMLVMRNGTVKVTDFGIARAASANTITSTESAGSVHYISPEQARGGYSDERSDIYSLGVTMYEMATGRVPFDGDNNVSIALAHLQKEAIAVKAYYDDIPESLNKIIAKAMQKKPERRYQTIQELILDLKRVFTNPDGDYVRMVPILTDSPTIMLSPDEREKIKSGIKKNDQLEVFPIHEKQSVGEISYGAQGIEEKTNGIEESERQLQREKEIERRKAEEQRRIEEQQRAEIAERERAQMKASRIKKDPEEEESDQESEGMDPKLEKLVFVLGIVAAVLVAMFIIFMIGKSLKLFSPRGDSTTQAMITTTEAEHTTEPTTNEKQVEMIKITGRKYNEAQTMLAEIGLSMDPEYVKSDSVEKDYIISQDVREGEKVAEGTQIKVEISLGDESVTVPNFLGDSKSSAQSKADNAKLKVSFVSDYNDTAEKDTIFRQSLSSGNKVEAYTTITLTISLGQKETKPLVPDFSNMSKADAQDLAKELGLVLKPIEEYNEAQEGLIYDQDVAVNKEVSKGTVITVYISKGIQPVTKYTGTFTLGNGANPFTEGENEEGYVQVIADQDGNEHVVFEGTLTYEDFPKTITFTSESDVTAHVYMTVDGVQTNFTTVVAMN